MNHRPRFAFTHGQKAILWIGSFICLWQLLQVPAVVDMMLDFYAAGIIPGTNVVLAPDTVLRLLFALLFSIGVILFYRKFGRSRTLPRISYEERHAALHQLLSVLYRQTVRQPANLVYPADRWRTRTGHIVERLPMQRLGRVIKGAGRALVWLLTMVGMTAERTVRKAAPVVATAIVYAGMALGAATKWVWRGAEPGIRQFDHWLERKVHEYEAGVVVVDVIRSILKIPNGLWQKVVATPNERSK